MDNLAVRGRIFDIQRFSTHDGPGIRTIVFLKGCALRCRWCCNPESQSYEIETMLQNGKPKIMGRDVTVKEVLSEVLQDRPYYNRSGGGITLSGGESLLQPDFAVALLKACKDNGVNTAIETTGFANAEVIERFLPYLDTVLMDIKHINSDKHKEFTKQPNERILENAKLIASKAKKLIIRVPVIPTFNDTVPEIAEIAAFASN
ncbi:MAG: radical SAM protein, partial [Clostridia bacterium]|nr:radical SAM protein [Clostridia bacterium]